MAHHAAKLPACANCHYLFRETHPDEFCPRCGQQNQEVSLHVGHVVEEALEGFFHFDGKVWQTLRLLLFRPGELTRRFLAGHRVPYVPPIRLYVFISFVFFLLLSLTSGNPLEESKQLTQAAEQRAAAKQAQATIDSVRREVRTSLGASGVGQLAAAATDSALARAARSSAKGTAKGSMKGSAKRKHKDTGMTFNIGDIKLEQGDLESLPAHPEPEQVDSVLKSQHKPLTFSNRLAVRRIARWSHSSREEIWHQLLRGSSILLFFLMPLAALLLKAFYLRRGRLYLGHLIFTIHLHCFLFVMLTLSIALSKVKPAAWDLDNIPLLLAAAYFVLALRRVYAQSWLKTIAKSVLLSFSYSLALAFSTGIVAIIGLMLF